LPARSCGRPRGPDRLVGRTCSSSWAWPHGAPIRTRSEHEDEIVETTQEERCDDRQR
jgi:hypothetical protein